MFGHILVNSKNLSEEEKKRYNEIYCGVCHALGEMHGQMSRFSLTYDMTFLALFLSSLYEPEENKVNKCCPVHPIKSKEYVRSKFTDYAADMSVFLMYYKCIDDWEDEKDIFKRGFAALIHNNYNNAKTRFPLQEQAIKKYINELSALERAGASADETSACFGKMTGEIFRFKDDIWGDRLYEFGFKLGKFIYLLDAAIDIDKDIKKCNYNPFVNESILKDDIENILLNLIGEAAQVFEKLPLVQDENILRNIIYSGVWLKYNAEKAKIERKQNNGQ